MSAVAQLLSTQGFPDENRISGNRPYPGAPTSISQVEHRMQMVDELFVVAGYPGSGKSTLIQEATMSGFDLFGPGSGLKLKTLSKAMPDCAWNLGIEEISKQGYYYSANHLPFLAAGNYAELATPTLIHLDLVGWIENHWLYYPCADPARLVEEFSASCSPMKLLMRDNLTACFLRFLKHPFIARCRSLKINTLQVSIETADLHAKKRSDHLSLGKKKYSELKALIYADSGSRVSRAFHDNIYWTWNSVLAQLDSDAHLEAWNTQYFPKEDCYKVGRVTSANLDKSRDK